jgi:hypothetical protein
MPSTEFDVLYAEGLAAPIEGWDFTRFGDRIRSEVPPWGYWDLVAEAARGAGTMLDLGTGGGEQLATFWAVAERRRPFMVATESWPPNVPVAAARLRRLGIPVVHTERAPDNSDQAVDERRGRLPFRDGAFALVIDRHEAFNAREVSRVLAATGVFLTQQVGGDNHDVYDLMDVAWPGRQPFSLELAIRQLTRAGLDVNASHEALVTVAFADVAAFTWYLRQVPWVIPEVDVVRDVHRLRAVHQRIRMSGPVHMSQRAFWLRAVSTAGQRVAG